MRVGSEKPQQPMRNNGLGAGKPDITFTKIPSGQASTSFGLRRSVESRAACLQSLIITYENQTKSMVSHLDNLESCQPKQTLRPRLNSKP